MVKNFAPGLAAQLNVLELEQTHYGGSTVHHTQMAYNSSNNNGGIPGPAFPHPSGFFSKNSDSRNMV